MYKYWLSTNPPMSEVGAESDKFLKQLDKNKMGGVTLKSTEHYNALIDKIDTLHDAVISMGHQLLGATSKWMTTKQVQDHLSKSENWVLQHKHHIGCTKSAGTLLFKRTYVEEFLEADYFRIGDEANKQPPAKKSARRKS